MARTLVGREKEGPLCDPGSELQLGGMARVVRGRALISGSASIARRRRASPLRAPREGPRRGPGGPPDAKKCEYAQIHAWKPRNELRLNASRTVYQNTLACLKAETS